MNEVLTFHCIHCHKKLYLWDKETHAREAHGYREIPVVDPLQKKKRKVQMELPGIERKRKVQTD